MSRWFGVSGFSGCTPCPRGEVVRAAACESGLVHGPFLCAVFSEVRVLALAPLFAFDPAPILPLRLVVIQVVAHILVPVVGPSVKTTYIGLSPRDLPNCCGNSQCLAPKDMLCGLELLMGSGKAAS